jgi:hypothetical protein
MTLGVRGDAGAVSPSTALEGLAVQSEAYRATHELLPPRFREHQTRRFVVFSDTNRLATQQYEALLERTHHQFLRFCRRLGLEPRPLRHRLVAVIFDRRDAYQHFAQRHDGVADAALAGYYAPRNDRVVIYNVESNPSVVAARAQLDELHQQVRDLASAATDAARIGRADEAHSLQRDVARYQQHLAHHRRRVDAFADESSTATSIHEATHQLLFHTGVQSSGVEYPLWISEGLATSFESEAPLESFGPDREYAPRREDFRRLLVKDRLLPLHRLITLTITTEAGGALMHVAYHQSYALITWMYRFRSEELAAYLRAMASEPAGRPTPERHRAIFEAAFGDLETLERDWLRYEKSK